MISRELWKLLKWGPAAEGEELLSEEEVESAEIESRLKARRDAESLENHVQIFKKPYEFVRELVQNAVDAHNEVGVAEAIELWTEFNPFENGDKGIFVFHIRDQGIGMDLKTINRYLTQLSSSTKSEKPELIGEFGVGFVSVFAMDPNAVIVDTGQGGESWRLIFKENRKFDRISLSRPFNGTEIQLVKEVSSQKAQRMERSLEDALELWCGMSPLEINFNGEAINQDFDFDCEWAYRDSAPSYRLSVRLREQDEPAYQIYRQGLLIEQGERHDLSIAGFRYRLDWNRARTTITRDGVRREKAFFDLLNEIRGKVFGAYLDELLGLISKDELPDELVDGVFEVLSFRLSRLSKKRAAIPLIKACDGSKLSILELCKLRKDNRIEWTSQVRQDLRIPLWDGASPGLARLVAKLGTYKRTFLGRWMDRQVGKFDTEFLEHKEAT